MNAQPGDRRGRFDAPWSRLLKSVSVLASVVLVGSGVVVWVAVPEGTGWVRWTAAPVGLVILGISALFTVRGYELRGRELLVRRLCWDTRVSLEGLREAYADPEAMRSAIRLMGNGGLYSFSGWFRNRRLGRFRAFVTDPARSVVLVFKDRKVLVTPDRPAEFLRALGCAPKERAE
jgi:hypothetical protein